MKCLKTGIAFKVVGKAQGETFFGDLFMYGTEGKLKIAGVAPQTMQHEHHVELVEDGESFKFSYVSDEFNHWMKQHNNMALTSGEASQEVSIDNFRSV